MADKKIVGWFTMNGKHIPVFEGESKADAVKRSVKGGVKAPGKDKQPVPKGQTDKKWKDFEEASRKADVMRNDIDYPEYYKKEREAGREFDKSVKQEQAHGTISIKRKKPSVADKSKEKSPRAEAEYMTESQLRKYVKDNNLSKQYNMMLNGKPNYSHNNQMQVLRDLVSDNIARKRARIKKEQSNAKVSEDRKQKQIAENKALADKLNGKKKK